MGRSPGGTRIPRGHFDGLSVGVDPTATGVDSVGPPSQILHIRKRGAMPGSPWDAEVVAPQQRSGKSGVEAELLGVR
jgi:hypothetical protein